MTTTAPVSAPALSAWLRKAFGLAVIAFTWWRFSENTADNDLWGHVLYGQRMLHLGGLETTETLSWTATGLPWINHEVLAEIALGLAHRLAGGAGLWSLMMILAAATLGWAWHSGAGPDRTRRLTALALLALCTNFIALGYAVRPQLFTYLFFVALLVSLRHFFAGRLIWGCAPPVLLAVWVNTHGGFLAGWVITLVALTSETFAGHFPTLLRCVRCEPMRSGPGHAALVALGCTGVLLLNPWGWRLVTWTFETVLLPRPYISEWQPMPFNAGSLPFYFTIVLGVLAWGVSRQPRRLWEIIVWALLAVIAIRSQRHAPLFGLASLLFLPAHLPELLLRLSPHTASLRNLVRRPAVAICAVLVLLGASGRCIQASMTRARPFGMEVPRMLFPVSAIAYMKAHQLTGNTITFFDWGQMVLWELPDNPVSFDGRLDTVYPTRVMDAHWRLYAGQDPGPSLDLARARVALLPSNGGGVHWLRGQGWKIVCEDNLATVLVPSIAHDAPTLGGVAATAGSVPFPDVTPMLATRAARISGHP
ncbi:MAG TPA: hypothetical protein VIM71_00950 [Lacunisphaera sp.]